MEPKEPLEIRTQMAEMHESVIKRINEAYNDKQYIEVCWLCYACFESRVNRMMEKICSGCSKVEKKDNRKIGITTKLECYVRLIRNGYAPMKDENENLVNTVKGWCKERNDLIHGMVSLEFYNDADKKFASLAKRGKTLVERMYKLGTDVRTYYYEAADIPKFPAAVIEKCPLHYKCIKEN